MMKYIVVIGVAVALVAIGSSGKIPWVDRSIAVSQETRQFSAAATAPEYTRLEAISLVEEYLRTDCQLRDRYLPNLSRFEATFIYHPFTSDHYEREDREWTVVDPISGGIWRLSETTGVIRMIRGSC
ncbi:MAG: hypothetical protein J4O02_03560 [Chloroflexi bacterium]|nr:hypothetical protein [Chloroflexota bacterium]MCI0812625.1 hypothetical protein [Chloroflexota bacterium]